MLKRVRVLDYIHKIKLKQAYNERVLSNAFRDDSS